MVSAACIIPGQRTSVGSTISAVFARVDNVPSNFSHIRQSEVASGLKKDVNLPNPQILTFKTFLTIAVIFDQIRLIFASFKRIEIKI